MTDFFARQEQARARTWRLLMLFGMAVVCTVLLVYLVVLYVVRGSGHGGVISLWDRDIFLICSGATLLVIGLGSLAKLVQLRHGGSAVAVSLGGRLVNRQTRDPDERRLLNVVEEMSIASGVPMPQVYVLDEEPGINAFAAGLNTGDAVVAVTRGALKWLTRDELQGVVAHEFSHILNGDMRLNIRLMALIAGILGLSIIGRVLMRTRGRGKGAGQLQLIGLAFFLIGIIGAFFARLIQAAVSRQREFLADASAVQFTRLPDGLAGALKKIGALAEGSQLRAATAAEAGHLFFSDGLSQAWSGLLSTHPPLVERIKAIEPSFNGRFPILKAPPFAETPAEVQSRKAPFPTAQDIITAGVLTAGGVRRKAMPASRLFAHAGKPTVVHLKYAADLRAALPANVIGAAAEPYGATILIYAMLLSRDPAIQQKQLAELEEATSRRLVDEVRRLLPDVRKIPPDAILPVVDLAIPALRELSKEQFDAFEANLQMLIESDKQIDLFEFTLQKILRRHLAPVFRGEERVVQNFYSPRAIVEETAVLLSAIAHSGNDTPEKVREAFEAGVAALPPIFGQVELVPWEECYVERLDAALDKCSQAVPHLREMILKACASAAAADKQIKPSEAELLRAIADALGCPVPPYVEIDEAAQGQQAN